MRDGRADGAEDASEAGMRRVVVTGMGIVSSFGNNTQEFGEPARAQIGGRARPTICRAGFRSQVHGAPTRIRRGGDRRAMRFLGAGAAWNHVAMDRRSVTPAWPCRGVERAYRDIMGRWTLTRAIVRGPPTLRAEGRTRRPFAGAETMSSTASATARHLVQDQRRELFDSSACATSITASVMPQDLQCRRQDIDLCRRLQSSYWTLSVLFDAMGAMYRS